MSSKKLKKINKKNPKVAIIGGGVFGMTAALILGRRFSVTLFEKNSDILGEATLANQYRHHHGFHYPRSIATINEIERTRKDFERFYKSIIVSTPSYYCVSKTDSNVSPGKYLGIFKKLGVSYKSEYPPREFLNRNTVGVCVRTPEAVYDYKKLKNFIDRRIRQNRNIVLKLNSAVTNAKISHDGQKTLSIRSGREAILERFDYVINATYAEYNKFCGWLSFPQKKLKFRLKEIIVARLKSKKRCAVTIMDGPFATLVPMGNSPDIYTFGDVPLSVHKSFNNLKNLNLSDLPHLPASRWLHMKKRCMKWFPLLKDAEYIKSMFVILPTEMVSEKNDDRPTDVVSHGSGCWSIFSGKIMTAVAAANKILADIKKDLNK